jgi:hypothetical protein
MKPVAVLRALQVTVRATKLRTPLSLEILIAGFALVALLVVQWMLSAAIQGTNYYGVDGKMAQATILTMFEFGSWFEINNINPIEGVGSQLLPMNVWANPAYWPFALVDKELATDLSAMVALTIFATAAYVMARCFDVPILASLIAAQSSIVLFAPAVLILQLPTVFCLTPGNAVVYAPHMVALGLLGRLEPGSWRSFGLITAGIFGLLFYSLYCDPLWTMVNGISWSAAFAVVTFGPLRMKTVLVRCAALGFSVALLVASGAAEYLYTLSQYTARVQFPEVLDRERGPGLASALSYSPNMKYYYLACTLGWLLALLALRGRSRLFAAAGAVSCVLYAAYSVVFLLLLNGTWVLPIPMYVEQSLFPLLVTTAAAGYWGVLSAAASASAGIIPPVRQRARASARALIQRMRFAAIRHGMPRLAYLILPVSRRWGGAGVPATRNTSDMQSEAIRLHGQYVARSLHVHAVTIALQLAAAAVIPAYIANFALSRAQTYAQMYHERWPNEPALSRFFADNIHQSAGQPFRGSVLFWYPDYPALLTMVDGWVRTIPTANEYSQLVTPQALYFIHVLLKKDVRANLNWFQPTTEDMAEGLANLDEQKVRDAANKARSVGSMLTTEAYWTALRMFGVRYFVGYSRFALAEDLGFPLTTLRHARIADEPAAWNIYEIPHPNVGNYSPIEVMTAGSGAEIMTILGEPKFDATQQAVLSTPIAVQLVPAREMRMSHTRSGLHVSGRSDGTSLVVLPQQFSNCLRARDERVRLMRANLMMTGLIFSDELDTDIFFDYGIFTPACRRADLADMKRLNLKIDLRMWHLSGDQLFPDWKDATAKLRAIVGAIK